MYEVNIGAVLRHLLKSRHHPERRCCLMLTIEKYKGTRFWAVFRDGELLAVTVYKRGAEEIVRTLEARDG